MQVVCPHCGARGGAYKLRPRASSLKGTHVRPGLRKCGKCRKEFTVTVGTIFHNSRIPLHKWLYAYHLLCTAEETVNAYRLHRALGITYKSAWFMIDRLKLAWKEATRKNLQNGPELWTDSQGGAEDRSYRLQFQNCSRSSRPRWTVSESAGNLIQLPALIVGATHCYSRQMRSSRSKIISFGR